MKKCILLSLISLIVVQNSFAAPPQAGEPDFVKLSKDYDELVQNYQKLLQANQTMREKVKSCPKEKCAGEIILGKDEEVGICLKIKRLGNNQ